MGQHCWPFIAQCGKAALRSRDRSRAPDFPSPGTPLGARGFWVLGARVTTAWVRPALSMANFGGAGAIATMDASGVTTKNFAAAESQPDENVFMVEPEADFSFADSFTD